MWKDVTSYSQSDKKRLPSCWSVRVGNFKISLVWNHRYCPDTWSTSLYGVYENHDLKLSSYDDLKSAQRKALLLAEKVFGDALSAVKKEAANTSANRQITPCERHSCCNCGNASCSLNGVNCSKFVPRTA